MKSLKELEAIRDRMRQTVNTRESDSNTIRVVVGMATCGISAGARPVLNAIVEELARENVAGVQVTQTGCIGHVLPASSSTMAFSTRPCTSRWPCPPHEWYCCHSRGTGGWRSPTG